MQKHNCDEASKIRPGYKGCEEITAINTIEVKALGEQGDRAAVHLHVKFARNNKPEKPFSGYLWLKRNQDQHWQIQNDNKDIWPDNKISLDKFLRDIADITLTEQEILSKQLPSELYTPPPLPIAERVDVTLFKTFGSEKILNACWTPEQLRGDPKDRIIISMKNHPDRSPPQREIPRHTPKPLPAKLQKSIRTVRIADPSEKLVALTFDLCERVSERTGYDAAIVNYLREHNIKATFYAGGKWMRSHPDKAKQLMADPLFEIGNHAWTHGNMRVLEIDKMKSQVLRAQAQYELLHEDLAKDLQRCGVPVEEMDRIPPIPLSFRNPYGTCSTQSLDFLGDYGLPAVQWNIVTADPWRKQTARGITDTILNGIKSGSIIIAHANGRGWNTAEALPRFIPELLMRGYQFVTITELLAAGKDVEATNDCSELHPGDNQRYDKKVGNGTE